VNKNQQDQDDDTNLTDEEMLEDTSMDEY